MDKKHVVEIPSCKHVVNCKMSGQSTVVFATEECSTFFILCAQKDRFLAVDYSDPDKQLFDEFLAHMDGKLSHTDPSLLAGIQTASRTTSGQCVVVFQNDVPEILPEFHKHMSSLLIQDHKFKMEERKAADKRRHKPFGVIHMYVNSRSRQIPNPSLVSIVMKQNNFPGTAQLVQIKKVGEEGGRQVKMTADLELMTHLSGFPIAHPFNLGTAKVILKSQNRRLPTAKQIQPSFQTPGIPSIPNLGQSPPPGLNRPVSAIAGLNLHNPLGGEEPSEGTSAPDGPKGFIGQEISLVIAGEGDVVGTIDPCGVWRANGGRFASLKKSEVDKIVTEENQIKMKKSMKEERQSLAALGMAPELEGAVGEQRYENFLGLDHLLLGTIDPNGVWRANDGEYADMSLTQIRKKLEKDRSEKTALDTVAAAVLGTPREDLGVPGERKTFPFEGGGRIPGIFDMDGIWRCTKKKMKDMTKAAIDRKILDTKMKKERDRLNNELKHKAVQEAAAAAKDTDEQYGEPGTTKFLFFPGEGNLLGTFDLLSTWIANTGRFKGKSKGFIRKALAKEKEKETIEELKAITSKKGFSGKLQHGTPGTQRLLHFAGDVHVMGTYDEGGVWVADQGTEWAGRSRGSIAGKLKKKSTRSTN